MQELLNNIDQHQSSTTPRLPGTNDVRSFQNFEVTPSNLIQDDQQQHHQQPPPKKDVFQIFQKVAEQFSLVTDINQNVGETKNSIESTTPPVLFTETEPSVFPENPLSTTDHPDLTSAGLSADDDSPGNLRNVVIQADKKNAKSFSSASSTATSSSGLIRYQAIILLLGLKLNKHQTYFIGEWLSKNIHL